MISLKELVKAGVHFGHRKSRWNPKMAPYIWGHKSGTHLIDVSKTARQLEKAARFLESIAANGGTVLWVGTKKAAQNPIAEIAGKLGQPYVTHRWIGGTLTNNPQVKKSVTKLLHLEDILKKSASQSYYTKKELGMFQKNIDRLEKNVGSIRNFSLPVGAVVVVDVKKEQTALREAQNMGIPTVALVDTNSDPTTVDYVIPANDDASKAIAFIVGHLAEAVDRGGKAHQEQKAKEKEAAAQKREAAKAAKKDEKTAEEKPKKAVKEATKPKAEAKKADAKPVEKAAAKKAPAAKTIKAVEKKETKK